MKLDYSSLILSASGWRGIFVESGNEEDSSTSIGKHNILVASLMAESYAHFIKKATQKDRPCIVVATDTRPTGTEIAAAALAALAANGIEVLFIGISAAPETMAYSRDFDGFMYISASHNPIGHNGIKFGLNDGGVLDGQSAAMLSADFKALCDKENACEYAESLLQKGEPFLKDLYAMQPKLKNDALDSYIQFEKLVISGSEDTKDQDAYFERIAKSNKKSKISAVCDMNGSARTVSIDKDFLTGLGIGFYAINNEPGKIAHAIIPEGKNLTYCADFMTQLQKEGNTEAVLGYMPDCDGDRGNIVFWDAATNKASVLQAQEVFALCVLSETASLVYQAKNESASEQKKIAVVVNGPTSMRIEEIAHAFGAIVARAEVGEANVVNKARELRNQGYEVRILGEGSNGGNITHPAAVRDPLNTVFALLKLLLVKDLFRLWCEKSGQGNAYKDEYSINDIIETLPQYITTGVSEERALANVTITDHAALKREYQKVFLAEWEEKKADLERDYGITNWQAVSNNGTVETRNVADFSMSGKGGFKILFFNKNEQPIAFIWMRGSGTEPVFRVICDVKGRNAEIEKKLLEWHSQMIQKAQLL